LGEVDMRTIACLVAIIATFFLPTCAETTNDWYAPKLIKGSHEYPDFSFLEGQWRTKDKKFTEDWTQDAYGHLMGVRTFIRGKYNEKNCYLFAFEGTKVGARINFRRLNARLENLSAIEEIFQSSWKNPAEHKGTISIGSNQGLRIISRYDCPSKNRLDVEIETNGAKETINLVRARP
jgi:hypothetical protein